MYHDIIFQTLTVLAVNGKKKTAAHILATAGRSTQLPLLTPKFQTCPYQGTHIVRHNHLHICRLHKTSRTTYIINRVPLLFQSDRKMPSRTPQITWWCSSTHHKHCTLQTYYHTLFWVFSYHFLAAPLSGYHFLIPSFCSSVWMLLVPVAVLAAAAAAAAGTERARALVKVGRCLTWKTTSPDPVPVRSTCVRNCVGTLHEYFLWGRISRFASGRVSRLVCIGFHHHVQALLPQWHYFQCLPLLVCIILICTSLRLDPLHKKFLHWISHRDTKPACISTGFLRTEVALKFLSYSSIECLESRCRCKVWLQ